MNCFDINASFFEIFIIFYKLFYKIRHKWIGF